MTSTQTRVSVLAVALILFAAAALLLQARPVSAQYNYDHVNVTATVNVTNAAPEILAQYFDQNITLVAGSTKFVTCNATIRDWNGYNDLSNVNATMYYYLNSSGQADDANEHYTNASCIETANDGQYLANYSCGFDVQYFANNGTWYCNMSVIDNSGFVASNETNTTINALYALNVTDVIDYGNLSLLEYSDNITATVTNFGNSAINVSVLGYGATEGDGIGLVCNQGTNITVDNERFSGSLVDWTLKTPLSATNQDMNITLFQQQSDVTPVTYDTYWQLYVPPNPFGVCTGTVRFTATTI